MKSIALSLLLLLPAAGLSTGASAQSSTSDLLKDLEATQRRTNLEIERLQRRPREIQAQSDSIDAATDRAAAELMRLLEGRKADDTAQRAQDAAKRAEREAKEQLERAKEELLEEMQIQSTHTKNYVYALLLAGTITTFLWYVIRNKKRSLEGEMKYSEKFGVMTILASGLLILLALVISDDWYPRLDFFQNLLSTLKIAFFKEESQSGSYTSDTKYMIDIPTRYVVWFLLCLATYGLTTYLGITPAAWKPKPGTEPTANENAK